MRPRAPDTRGMLTMEIEHGRMQVFVFLIVGSSTASPEDAKYKCTVDAQSGVLQIIVIGYGKDYPPADMVGLMAFIESLGFPELSEVPAVSAMPVSAKSCTMSHAIKPCSRSKSMCCLGRTDYAGGQACASSASIPWCYGPATLL